MAGEQDPTPRTEALVHAFQGGAEQSFAPLYERLAPALYAWAVLRAPRGIDPTDLLGEVWLHAVRNLHRYEVRRASFRAWLFGVAKKVLLHELRDLDRRASLAGAATRGSDKDRVDLERVPESVTSLSRRIERDDLLLRFLERIDGMGQEEHDLVIHCGLEGLSCGEAALRLGLSEQATTKRWQRLRSELRNSKWAEELLA